MEGRSRAALRSSARLSGGGSAPAPAGRPEGAAARRARSAQAAADAARRRARALERAREVEDSPRVLRDKCRRLAHALRNAKHLVVYTGAGISTAADIPDYRGPDGVWTRLQRGETVGRVEVSRARPTFTHMALTALWARGLLKFVASQNCDGLHVRAGLPRRALAELHGDMFAERCPRCRRVLLRAFDVTQRTARHRHATRRLCPRARCGAELRDCIVHFGERGRAAWPLNWAGALRHAAAADVVLCLGSSLKVLRRYPRLWRMQHRAAARPQLYIVNLQWTPKDAVAALKINARCDAVMRLVARRLRLRVPRYRRRRDPLLAHAVPLAPPERHTSRRVPLSVPASSASSSTCSEPSDLSDLSASSASDSDDELPLRRLAARLRLPLPLPLPLPDPAPPSPDALHSFQVSMRAGEATILLRARHAPAAQPPPPPPPTPPPLRRPLSDLRRFRIERGPVTNGHGPAPPRPPPAPLPPLRPNGVKTEPTNTETSEELDEKKPLKTEPLALEGLETKPIKAEADEAAALGARLRRLLAAPPERDASALAAAIIARALLLCRPALYPGLHTILAPPAAAPAAPAAPAPAPAPPAPAPAPAAPECAWCARHYAARRCLWYGPPPPAGAALERRVWRRVGARRYLCACCGADEGEGGEGGEEGAGEGEGRGEAGEGGWYGKGYRKGRRRR